MDWIVSSIAGRMRLRHRTLREPGCHAALLASLSNLDGIVAVEGSVRTGSLLLRYDAERVGLATMEARVTAIAGTALGLPEVPRGSGSALVSVPERRGTSSKRSYARRLNTYSKIGMLCSLGASLALAAVGKKHLHAATGALFTALLAIHMAVHRRHLLK